MHRYKVLLVIMLALFSPMTLAADGKTVVVLDTELIIDNKPTPHSPDRPGEQERAGYMTQHISEALDRSAAYQVVSRQPAQEVITDLQESRAYLHQCESCMQKIGQQIEADYIATSWVQVVSNLIINLNLVLHDANTGEAVMTSFVDIRGNNNSTWRNGTNYMLEKFFREYHDRVPETALKQAESVWPAGDASANQTDR